MEQLFTIKLITDRLRELAGKVEEGSNLSDEDKIFIKNALRQYAFRLDTKSTGRLNATKTDSPDLVEKRERVLSRRVERQFKELSGVPFEPQKPGRKKS